MRNKISLFTSFFLAVLYNHSFAQTKSLSKLEVVKGDTYVVGSGNQLFVDTLIMQDKSTIAFDPTQYGVLEAKAVYIGKNCTITSKGKMGKNGFRNEPGADGTDGGSLTLTLHFKALESLTVDTRGGNGGKGVNGRNGSSGTDDRNEVVTTTNAQGITVTTTVFTPGEPGTDGGDATGGGSGGNGGNIMLVYSTDGFFPNFNNARGQHDITILHTAGTNGTAGVPGIGGRQRQDGTVIYKELQPAKDGRVSLINVDAEAAQ